MSAFREAAALQIALVLTKTAWDRGYQHNVALNKSKWEYIAEDSVALADALIVRLKGTPIANYNVNPSHNTIPVEFSKA